MKFCTSGYNSSLKIYSTLFITMPSTKLIWASRIKHGIEYKVWHCHQDRAVSVRLSAECLHLASTNNCSLRQDNRRYASTINNISLIMIIWLLYFMRRHLIGEYGLINQWLHNNVFVNINIIFSELSSAKCQSSIRIINDLTARKKNITKLF